MLEANHELVLPQPIAANSAQSAQDREANKRFGKLEREYVFEVAKKLVLQHPDISHAEVVKRTINQYKSEYPVERHFMCTFEKVSEILTNGAKLSKTKKRKYGLQKLANTNGTIIGSPNGNGIDGSVAATVMDTSLPGFPDNMLGEDDANSHQEDISQLEVTMPLPSPFSAAKTKKPRPGIHNPELIAGGVTGVNSSVQRRLGGLKKSLQQVAATKDVLVNLRSGRALLTEQEGLDDMEDEWELDEEEAEFRYATKTFLAAIEKRRKTKPFIVTDQSKTAAIVYLSRDEKGQDELILHNVDPHPVIANLMQALLFVPTPNAVNSSQRGGDEEVGEWAGEDSNAQKGPGPGGESSSNSKRRRSSVPSSATKIMSTANN